MKKLHASAKRRVQKNNICTGTVAISTHIRTILNSLNGPRTTYRLVIQMTNFYKPTNQHYGFFIEKERITFPLFRKNDAKILVLYVS